MAPKIGENHRFSSKILRILHVLRGVVQGVLRTPLREKPNFGGFSKLAKIANLAWPVRVFLAFFRDFWRILSIFFAIFGRFRGLRAAFLAPVAELELSARATSLRFRSLTEAKLDA